MGNRPNAHLWLGTKALTDEHPWCTQWSENADGDEVEVVPEEDIWDADSRLKAEGISLVDLSNRDGDGDGVALALSYTTADWDGVEDIGPMQPATEEQKAKLIAVAKREGWPAVLPEDIHWRLGASYG